MNPLIEIHTNSKNSQWTCLAGETCLRICISIFLDPNDESQDLNFVYPIELPKILELGVFLLSKSSEPFTLIQTQGRFVKVLDMLFEEKKLKVVLKEGSGSNQRESSFSITLDEATLLASWMCHFWKLDIEEGESI